MLGKNVYLIIFVNYVLLSMDVRMYSFTEKSKYM